MEPSPSSPPLGDRVSVVVPTRNRAAHAAACAATIVRNPHFAELVFVDQSDDDSTEKALAVRRDVVARIGAFDALLGAGAPLPSGGEPDFLFRVLKAGLKVVNAREVELEHLGARAPGPEEKRLLQAYALGTAAALFKHVR